MSHEQLAILSPGDMGHAVGAVWIEAGHRVTTDLSGRSAETRSRAERAGFADRGSLDALVSEADWIVSILPPSAAEDTAERVAAAMRRCGRAPAYADCNAISPNTARRIAATIGGVGADFVDGSLVGAAPGAKRPATRLYVSGPRAGELASLSCATPRGAIEVRELGSEIGRASALKMTYAGLTKTTNALYTNVLTAAARLGLFEDLARELQESQPQAWARMGVVPFLAADSERWVAELEEIAATFRDVGLPGDFHEGAAEIYRRLAATPLAEETRETLDRSRTLEDALEVYARWLAPDGER